jgi:hypothetical protein
MEEDKQLRRLMVTLVERHRKSHTDVQVRSGRVVGCFGYLLLHGVAG